MRACAVWSHLSPFWLVVLAVAAGFVYLALWGVRTALPLYRGYAEVVVQ